MKKIPNLYIIVLFLIAATAFLVYSPPVPFLLKINFTISLHKIFESIVTLLLFLIFLRANNLYSKTKDKRMAILAGGYLAAGLLNIYHLTVAYGYPYDTLSIENLQKNPQLYFLQVRYLITTIAIFLAVFYTTKPDNNTPSDNFRLKTYLTYFGVVFLSIILYILALPLLSGIYKHGIIEFVSSLGIIDEVLFFLTAFIFTDMRITNKKSIYSIFTIGLIILGIGQLFNINTAILQFRGIRSHTLKIIGNIFILMGIKNLLEITFVSYKQKILTYLSMFLIFAYIVFVSLSSAIFNINFPSYSQFLFIEFLLISVIIQNIIASGFTQPILNITEAMGRYKVGEKPEVIPITTNDELSAMTRKFIEVAETNWQYTQEISKARDKAELIRKIISAVLGSLDLQKILNTTCKEVLSAFKVDMASIENFPLKNNYSEWTISSQYTSGPDILGVNDIDFSAQSKEYLGTRVVRDGKDIIVDNAENSDLPDYCVDTCKKMNIKSFIAVPLGHWGALAVFQVHNYRQWTQDEIQLLHTIAEQVYIAIRQAELYQETKINAEREQILRTINNEILTSKTFEDAAQGIVRETGKLFDVDRSAIRLFNDATRTLFEFSGEYRRNETIPSTIAKVIFPKELDEYIIHQVFDNKQLIILDDIEVADIPDVAKEVFREYRIKEIIIAPLTYGDIPIGTISFSNIQTAEKWTQENIDFLLRLTQQVSIGIYVFNLTKKLTNSLESERAVREMIFEVRRQEGIDAHDAVFQYLSKKLVELFHVERVVHLHYDEYGNLYVVNEELTNTRFESMYNKSVLSAKNTDELKPKIFSETIIINDVETEIKDPELKEYLKSKNILSFMVYPRIKEYAVTEEEAPSVTEMLCSSSPRLWTQNEIDSFKLIVDTAALVYFEIRQRKELEETRKTFLSTLTHDLKSPLIAEQKALEVILSKRLGTSLDGFSKYLEDIYKTNEDLLRIVNNILSVYQYEQGKFELKLEETNVAELINESVSIMRHLAEDQKSKITINIQPDLPFVMVDRLEILRVINNLVSNAIKHNTSGTVINISVKKINGEVQVSVSDNGKGISGLEKPNIFQRYPTGKTRIGSGLGLYLTKQIIEAHHGKIWFESEINKGTIFNFTLPVA